MKTKAVYIYTYALSYCSFDTTVEIYLTSVYNTSPLF